MHKRVRRKKVKKVFYGIVVLCVIGFGVFFFVLRDVHDFVVSAQIERIVIVDDGMEVVLRDVPAATVSDVLSVYGRAVAEQDRVFPEKNACVFADDVIVIEREKTLTVHVDDADHVLKTYRDDIGSVIARADIAVGADDIIVPSEKAMIAEDMEATITRVYYEEEVVTKKIAFETIEKKDDDVNFLKRYTKQKGKNGTKEITYRIAYHDGEEVDRAIISEEITTEPVNEIIVQGTKVKLGKKHTGACSWYAHTGTMAAANPWLPKGSYVKVTNTANGKSVIVKINDRGPFVPGRIIDLDKVAFAKIAPLGAGVINVKMEEVVE